MKYKKIKKLYYSISEISEKLGIKPSVIRYWESEFKDLNPQKNRAGNRIYKEDDIDTIRLIHHYVHEKHLSIHDANDLIQDLKKEQLYTRKVKELNLIPVKILNESPDEDDLIEPLPEEDEFEKDFIEPLDDEGLEDTEEKEYLDFEIVARPKKDFKPEPFMEYVLDEEEEITEEEDSDEDVEDEIEENQTDMEFEIVSPTKETFIYPLEEESEENEEIPQTPIIKKEKPIATPIKETAPKADPELRKLLKKISSNINDIIDILKE